MEDLFLQLTAVVAVTVLVVLAIKLLSQPAIIGYILSGIIVGPLFLNYVHPHDSISLLGSIGVVFLLFIVGLGIQPKFLKEVGLISLITGVGQIISTSALGFIIASWLGYPLLTSLYLGAAFTFASTIIVLQLLYAKEENETLYGRISIGFLLVQDFAAMIIFLLLASFSPGLSAADALTGLAWRVVLVISTVYMLMRWVMPSIEKRFERSRETIFLFGLAVCFIFATVFSYLGFSRELGALFAGVMLSASNHHRDIAVRLAPLRDFFLMLFFVSLGVTVSPEALINHWPLVISFSLFVLLINPLVVMLLMRALNYTLATSFFAGLTITQISEFSLILLAAGAALGHVTSDVVSSATLVGLVTMFFSSYLIMNNKMIFNALEPKLRWLFGADHRVEAAASQTKYSTIVFGCHRLGGGIVEMLLKMKASFLVVDHDPEIIEKLIRQKVPHFLGSVSDIGLLEILPLKHCRTVISTVPDVEINLNLAEYLSRVNPEVVLLCVANHAHEASQLYKAGVTYVIMPPYLGRRYIVELISSHKFNRQKYLLEKKAHLKEISNLSKASL